MSLPNTIPTLTGKSFLVGILEIDDEHQVLFNSIDKLLESVTSSYSTSISFQILEELTEYSRTHFKVEECLMRLFNYPDLEGHQVQHRIFIDHLENLQSKILKEDITGEMIKFLFNWLCSHIMTVDTAYSKFIRNTGMQEMAADLL